MKTNFEFGKYGIGVEDIQKEVEKLIEHSKEAKADKGLFKVRTANEWIELAKDRPVPKMLFGELWFEGELCILFSDTNLGKSILAVQIGNKATKIFPKI